MQIYNWTPKVFNETNEDDIHDETDRNLYRKIPNFLKDAIRETNPDEVSHLNSTFIELDIAIQRFYTVFSQRNMVWVSCEGESPADIENLGPVHYSPRRGFPAYYFPYKNVRGYQPPVVAVQFERPKCE